jgi:hypothetical protein
MHGGVPIVEPCRVAMLQWGATSLDGALLEPLWPVVTPRQGGGSPRIASQM